MTFDIWVEGYSATGEHSDAQLLTKDIGKIEANTFDEAIEKYMKLVPNHGINKETRNGYISDEAFKNRRSNWNIWACKLFPDEETARKSFG